MEELFDQYGIMASIIIVLLFIIGYMYLKKRKSTKPWPIKAEEETAPNKEPEPLLIHCPACGTEISRYAPTYLKCGHPIHPTISNKGESHVPEQTIIIQQPTQQSNGTGTAGFVLSLISLLLSWLPGIGWIIWFLGLLLSFIGMFKSPRGLAVVGFIISIIDLIILTMLVGAFAGVFSLLF